MYVRLGFSVAINVDPDVLLIDEVLAVGDAEFQRKCTEKIAEFRSQGKTIVIVSHSLTLGAHVVRRGRPARARQADRPRPAGQVIDDYLAETFSDPPSEDGHALGFGRSADRAGRVARRVGRSEHAPCGPATRSPSGSTTSPASRSRRDVRPRGRTPSRGSSDRAQYAPRRPGCDRLVGTGYVDFHVPRLCARAGAYDVTAVGLRRQLPAPVRPCTAPLRFDVEAGDPLEETGVVSLGGKWRARRCAWSRPGSGRAERRPHVRRRIVVVTGEVLAPQHGGSRDPGRHIARALAPRTTSTSSRRTAACASRDPDFPCRVTRRRTRSKRSPRHAEVVVVQGDALCRPRAARRRAAPRRRPVRTVPARGTERRPGRHHRGAGASIALGRRGRTSSSGGATSSSARAHVSATSGSGSSPRSGRINEAIYAAARPSTRLITVVPFGVPDDRPGTTASRAARRGARDRRATRSSSGVGGSTTGSTL